MTDLVISLQPKQKLLLQTVENVAVTFYGGAKGGGKSRGLRDILLFRRFKYAGSHGAIFRKSFPELLANHINKLFEEHPELKPYWLAQEKILKLPNGSTLQFCYCANEADLDLYQGREYHDLGIDEAGQWTESMFRKLLGSNRSSKPGIKARAILTGNPGGVGHAWLKRLFVERRFILERERPEDHAFIPALVYDNQALLENDPDYLHRLNSEPNEVLRKAYRDGDWDVFAGQFFAELNREVHFIKAFDVPIHWNRFGSYDFGFNHPSAFGWFAVDEDGNVFLYREFIKAQLRVDQFAEEILKYQDTKYLSPIVAGRDCWAKKGILSKDSQATIADEFADKNISLMPADIDRIQGANQLRSYLALRPSRDGTKKPRLYIMDSCPITFECLTRMQHDPDRVEDVLKVDASEGDINTGDDPYDMIRYGIMSRPMITESLPVKHTPGSDKWLNDQAKRMEDSIDHQARTQQAREDADDYYNIINSDTDSLSYHIQKRKNA